MASKGYDKDSLLPRRDRAQGQRDIEAQRRREERGGFGDREIGSGGARTTTDGRPVGEGHPDGYRSSR